MANQVQNNGLAKITALLIASSFWFQWGTGSAAAKTANVVTTTTTTESRASATLSQQTTTVVNDTFRGTATLTAAGTRAITEVGLFDAAGTGSPPTGGNMDFYGDFAAVNLGLGDALHFVFSTIFSSGLGAFSSVLGLAANAGVAASRQVGKALSLSATASVTLTATPSTSFTWPNATNTGTTGTLTTYAGPSTISAGTTLDSLIINNDLTLQDNVTITNCQINFSTRGIDCDTYNATGITIEHCEISGPGPSGASGTGQQAILGADTGSMTIRYCNIHDFITGVSCKGNTILAEYNYIHDPAWNDPTPSNPTDHSSAFVCQGPVNGLTVQFNTLTAFDTSNVFLQNHFGNMATILVHHNKMLGCNNLVGAHQTPSYNLYVDDSQGTIGGITGVTISDNVIEQGSFGYFSISATEASQVSKSGDTDYATGNPID